MVPAQTRRGSLRVGVRAIDRQAGRLDVLLRDAALAERAHYFRDGGVGSIERVLDGRLGHIDAEAQAHDIRGTLGLTLSLDRDPFLPASARGDRRRRPAPCDRGAG